MNKDSQFIHICILQKKRMDDDNPFGEKIISYKLIGIYKCAKRPKDFLSAELIYAI